MPLLAIPSPRSDSSVIGLWPSWRERRSTSASARAAHIAQLTSRFNRARDPIDSAARCGCISSRQASRIPVRNRQARQPYGRPSVLESICRRSSEALVKFDAVQAAEPGPLSLVIAAARLRSGPTPRAGAEQEVTSGTACFRREHAQSVASIVRRISGKRNRVLGQRR